MIFHPNPWLQHISGRVYLLIAVVIFAAAHAVTRRLMQLGADHLIRGENPVSFCNVLLVGNLVALVSLCAIYRRQLQFETFQNLSLKSGANLALVAILSGAIAPALFFNALALTSVNSVILVGRIEPPLTLALSVCFLRERVNSWVVVGAILAFVGVAITLVLQPVSEDALQMAGLRIGRGELLALGGAIAAAIGTLVSKASLEQVAVGFFSICRMMIGTIVFFVTALTVFGADHFEGVFSPIVWRWMLFYGLIIVVGGQLSWFEGLRRTTASEVAFASSFSPLAGILVAYLLLGESPTQAQYVGGAVILMGIALNQVGLSRPRSQPAPVDSAQTLDLNMGYKGI